MLFRPGPQRISHHFSRGIARAATGIILCLLPLAVAAQDRDSRDRDEYRDMVTRLEPGTVIPVRTNEGIDAERRDYRVYTAIVDQDVRGDNGGLAIPRGSKAELIVRVT